MYRLFGKKEAKPVEEAVATGFQPEDFKVAVGDDVQPVLDKFGSLIKEIMDEVKDDFAEVGLLSFHSSLLLLYT